MQSRLFAEAGNGQFERVVETLDRQLARLLEGRGRPLRQVGLAGVGRLAAHEGQATAQGIGCPGAAQRALLCRQGQYALEVLGGLPMIALGEGHGASGVQAQLG